MKVKVLNSSSRKTRERIKKSFALLMKEKQSLNRITVTDLVKEADITRSAFYTHYDNIYDVAKDLQDETFHVLLTDIDKLYTLENIDEYFDEIFAYIKKNEEIYSMILASNDPLFFTERLGELLTTKLIGLLGLDTSKNNLKLRIILFIDGSTSILIRKFRGEIQVSLEEINQNMKDNFKLLFMN